MKTIRMHAFETNSSSEHVLTLIAAEDYDKLMDSTDMVCTSTYNEIQTLDEVYANMIKEKPYKKVTREKFDEVFKLWEKIIIKYDNCEYMPDYIGEIIGETMDEDDDNYPKEDSIEYSILAWLLEHNRYTPKMLENMYYWKEEVERMTTKSGDEVVGISLYHNG